MTFTKIAARFSALLQLITHLTGLPGSGLVGTYHFGRVLGFCENKKNMGDHAC